MKKIAIIGAGRIGTAIQDMLGREGVRAAMFDVGYDDTVFDDYDVFVCATPWHATLKIAQAVAKREGKFYLDMTEDMVIGAMIRAGSRSVMIPHCGLAPGAVSIIAGSMLPCDVLYIAVGALPVNPVGQLGYALTWSTEGLVNEYCKPCPAIVDGVKVALNPLDDVRTRNGMESFNTSGGLGTLVDTLEFAGMRSVHYQTVRYEGHAKLMRFMRDDLGFQHKTEAWAKLLDENLPRGGEDVVHIHVQGGDGRYHRSVFGENGLSAIQRCTAAGLVAVLLWAINPANADRLQAIKRPRNWIANEDIPLAEVAEAKCWQDVFG